MALAPEHRSLLMRANRLLGAQLVEHNLVKLEDLETANERLLEALASNNTRKSSILGILAYEQKILREEDVLMQLAETEGIGVVDLRHYEVLEDLRKSVDVGACWATWSVPFDREEDVYYVATAYYLSPAVRAYWEKTLAGPILWYGTTLELIAEYLEKLETDRAQAITGAKPNAA